MSNIPVDKLQDAISLIFNTYTQEINEEIEAQAESIGREALTMIKLNAPQNYGKYARSWTMKNQTNSRFIKVVLYNKKYYHLTHLLEFGHIGKNQYGEWGEVNAKPHIKEAEKYVQDDFPKRCAEIIQRKRGG